MVCFVPEEGSNLNRAAVERRALLVEPSPLHLLRVQWQEQKTHLVWENDYPASWFSCFVAAELPIIRGAYFHQHAQPDVEPWLLHRGTNNPAYVLRGLRIELVGAAAFKKEWAPVVREAGGKVTERLFSDNANRIDLVVSETNALTPNILVENECAKLGVPLVSAKYLIDCIKLRTRPADASTYTARRVQE